MASKPADRLRQLREDGYRVKVSHLRRPIAPVTITDNSGEAVEVSLATLGAMHTYGIDPSPHGGETRVSILDGDGELLASAVAKCSAVDTFSRRLGLAIALGRAEKSLRA